MRDLSGHVPWLRSVTLLRVKSGFEDFEGCLAALSSPDDVSGSALRLTALGHTEQTLKLFPNECSLHPTCSGMAYPSHIHGL